MSEFNRTAYPESIGCKVMPAVSSKTVEVEVTDAEDNLTIFEVPSAAVIRMNMPQVLDVVRQTQMPTEIVKELEREIAIGLVACRIVERDEIAGLVKVNLPTTPDPTAITIPAERLARRV